MNAACMYAACLEAAVDEEGVANLDANGHVRHEAGHGATGLERFGPPSHVLLLMHVLVHQSRAQEKGFEPPNHMDVHCRRGRLKQS